MNKYDEFLEPYSKVFNEFMEFYWNKKREAQEKIDKLIDEWTDKHPECRGFYIFRSQLRVFQDYMDSDWLKSQFDYFHKLDEKFADEEFDESVKIV